MGVWRVASGKGEGRDGRGLERRMKCVFCLAKYNDSQFHCTCIVYFRFLHEE